mmetsp:Transcript_23938/g.38196  ORF Transcript_23938/g.38196 Transcript_23938/m.38196 type:complete len:137 (-) Transcript_23938:3432-3842(-)
MGDSDSSEDDLYGDGDIGAEKSNVKERKRKNSMDSLGKGDGEVLNIKLKFLKKGENTRSGAITVNSGLGICELKDTIGKVFNEKPEKLRLIFLSNNVVFNLNRPITVLRKSSSTVSNHLRGQVHKCRCLHNSNTLL